MILHIEITDDEIKQIIEKAAAKAEERWNNYEVACLLADITGEECACNINGNDEWLPKYCDFAEKECPHPVGLSCWEQFLKYRHLREEEK